MQRRDRAITELFYGADIRRAELAGFNVGDVDLARKHIRVLGKGAKERLCLITSTAAATMAPYEAARPTSTKSEAHFIGQGGSRISVRHVNRLFKGIADVAAIDEHATPHRMRHSVGTDLYENGMDLFAIAEQLGHENLQTTRGYARVSLERRRKQFDQSHPKERSET